jgi:hypothetical protein
VCDGSRYWFPDRRQDRHGSLTELAGTRSQTSPHSPASAPGRSRVSRSSTEQDQAKVRAVVDAVRAPEDVYSPGTLPCFRAIVTRRSVQATARSGRVAPPRHRRRSNRPHQGAGDQRRHGSRIGERRPVGMQSDSAAGQSCILASIPCRTRRCSLERITERFQLRARHIAREAFLRSLCHIRALPLWTEPFLGSRRVALCAVIVTLRDHASSVAARTGRIHWSKICRNEPPR